MDTSLLDRLRERGYRLTSQRRVVAEVLDGPSVHMSADEVHGAACRELPEISRATVYSTLHEFAEMGEVHELNLDGRSKRYDPNVSPRHHHLVCEQCGVVYDVQHGIEAPALSSEEQHSLVVRRADIVYYGICVDCGVEVSLQ